MKDSFFSSTRSFFAYFLTLQDILMVRGNYIHTRTKNFVLIFFNKRTTEI
jgi:hypothetical protein